MFSSVIVKKPGKSYVEGLTTSNLGMPNYEELLIQHENYVKALEKCNVNIAYLEADENYPDSTFVEDTAVLTSEFAVLCNPGAASRNGEIVSMEKELLNHFENYITINSPGHVDGGDVLQADQVFYIGISERTNEEGAKQLQTILQQRGFEAHIIPLKEFFHLKTGIAYLGNNKMILAGEFVDHELFDKYDKIIIPKEDEYSANCILVNDYVIIPSGYPATQQKLEAHGYKTIELPMSEFQKQDGGLSCLSLRF
ncbi:dimethylarginine dimethylaminohydrolase family protein [Kurthia sibirica]|uniref:N(G),N(G)-dimethylarginine dimethylaminohydrolase n=1 Tax=Kurthia sibirica TaxID=202750 RepID=A0A2U3AHV4_9BACL|nr:arginine deiminase family protein [Kurthia sibirica]PWI24136.1 N(G),N(G)-dimethylarginine dimethylaminohydrolase [Kurthia sibirica]GEK35488.1 N(G),N(G)-dimethylarginine dimethylaminohydrolase [Kurthia sibirica]